MLETKKTEPGLLQMHTRGTALDSHIKGKWSVSISLYRLQWEPWGGPVRNVHAVLNPTIPVLSARCSAVLCASVELLNKTDIFILARSDK